MCLLYFSQREWFPNTDGRMFIGYMRMRNISKNCFEVLKMLRIEKYNLSQILRKQYSYRRGYVKRDHDW